MRSGERKSYRAVVKGRRLPSGCVVASLAGLREGQSHVIGIRTFLIVGKVAAHAVGGRALESSSRMAGIAIECGVGAYQGKSGELEVVELGSEPIVHAMALLAAGWKTTADVAGFGGLEVLGVARIALCRKSLELPHRGALVARGTIQGRMRTHQGKAVLVLVDLLHRDLPSLDRVALFAGRAKLTLVDIGMAIGAFLSHVREHRLGVTLGATDPLMHAAQRKSGLAVVELRNIADRLPSAQGMAVLAGDVQRTVRALRAGVACPLRRSWRRHHQPEDDLYDQGRSQVFRPRRRFNDSVDRPTNRWMLIPKGATGYPKARVTVLMRGRNVTEVACRTCQADNAAAASHFTKVCPNGPGLNDTPLYPISPQLKICPCRLERSPHGSRSNPSGSVRKKVLSCHLLLGLVCGSRHSAHCGGLPGEGRLPVCRGRRVTASSGCCYGIRHTG